ncbi:MAG: hypothetical protein LBC70_07650 [Chitinispirillales bacterium]|jgi:hypothetical protein|nr:hypothetical protein [Chitinispirillales bacterium]
MLKRTLLPLAAGLCLTLTACGPSFRQIQTRFVAEAEYLKAEAAANNLRGNEIAIADSFLAKAQAAKGKDAADLADLAAAYYRLALARHSLEASAADLETARTALEFSTEQVEKYQEILTRVSAGGR